MDPLEYNEKFLNEIGSRYRSFIEQIPAIVYTAKYREPDRWLYVSPQIESLLGFSAKEWMQDPSVWYKQLHPDDREIAVRVEKIPRDAGQSFHREYRLITRDGRVVWVLDKATVITDASGQPVYLLGILHDITDHKKAEEELRRSEEIFRSAFENAPIGMAIVGFNDQILQVNQALCMILGYTRELLLSKTFAQITHPEDGETKETDSHGRIEGKNGSFTEEKRFVHGNGSMVWGQLDVSLVTDKRKKPLYFLQQVQDITERKRAEKLLQISGDRFRALIENGTDMISLVDFDGTITYSSPSTQRVLGYSSTEYLLTNFFEKIHEADVTWVKALFSELVTSPGKSFNAEFRYKHQNDTWRWIELTATNAMDEPSVGGVIANYRDITDNRNAQDAIQIRAAQQSVLAQISQRALVDSDLSVFMTDIVDKIAETLSAEYCMILELQPNQSNFLLRAGIGWRAGAVGNQLLEIDENSMVGHTLLSRALVLVDDLNSDKRFINQQFLLEHGVVSGMSVVIEGRDTPYGILAIHNAHHRSFSHNDIFILQAIANVLSAAIGRIQADEALRNSEERYMLVATSANDGLWDWNLRNNEIYYSPRWKEMLGYTKDEIKNDILEWLQRLHPADEERVRLALSPDLNARESRFELEFRIRHKDTSYRWALSRGVVIRDSAGVAYRMAGSLTDITERKLAEQQLHFDAFHDPLTGLSNRAYLMERLAHVIHISKRKRTYRFAVLFLDLDEFKVVNDRFGHNVGDRFLKEVARRLSHDMRSMDTLARLGGDEFVILLEDIKGIKEATQVAERVQVQLSEVFDLAEVKVTTSASIGIVCNDFVYEKPEDVLRDADIAMYSAKASGRAHYQVFSLTLREQTIVRLEREVDLRHALERNQFQIYYQPIYSFSSKLPIGVEALLRWKHPTQGLIMPSDFIKIAEDSNLIIPIDCFVLREACLQIQRWENLYPAVRAWGVHVNLSSKHFVQPNLVDTIQGIIRNTGFDPGRVNLEITESAIMENVELAMITTRNLHDFGIHLNIDDFGTGYSSLNYLTRFPVDVLKLDQSFVPRIMTDKNTREIIDTVVKLASKLGIRVVAEGIETIEQLYELQTLGCEYGQGYLFSKPMSRGAIAELVATKP